MELLINLMISFFVALTLCNGQCPDGWERFQDYCLKVVGKKESWVGAYWFILIPMTDPQKYCLSIGGNLATVDTPAKCLNIKALFDIDNSTDPHHIWIGGTDAFTSGQWIWIANGQPLVFSQWGPKEPSEGHHCISMNFNHDAWKARNCSHDKTHPFVCEKPAAVMPTNHPFLG